MAEQITRAQLEKLAESMSKYFDVPFVIEAGSATYGRAWKMTNKDESHVYLRGSSKNDLYYLMHAFWDGARFKD